MNLGEAITTLRSTRRFTDEPVASDAVARLLDAARWTGSARNRQPWRLAVVSDLDTRRRLSGLGDYAQHLAGAPLVVVVLTDAERGGADTEFDAGRLTQNLALAAHAEGLGSCVATLHPDEAAHAAARLVGFEPPWMARHALSIGHPLPLPADGTPALPQGRLTLEDLVSWIDARPA